MGKIAFVFSGQGAQATGMGKGWMDFRPETAAVFDMAEAIRPGTQAQCFTADKAELSQTVNTQPCLYCVDLAAAEALRASGIVPDMAAGFSLGEIPALAFCGILTAEDAFRLVCLRAEAMQACAEKTPGGMLAVLGLANDAVEAVCAQIDGAYPVNYNAPGQIVVAAKTDALPALREAVKQAGGKSLPLAVSGAFHSPIMANAERALREALAGMDLREPQIPLYANVTAAPYAEPYADLTAKQVTHPVRWQETIERMYADGADTFIEVGIGKTLCGLIRKILPDARVYSVESPETLSETLQALKGDAPC